MMRYYHMCARAPMFTSDGAFIPLGAPYWLARDASSSMTLSEEAYEELARAEVWVEWVAFDRREGRWRMKLAGRQPFTPATGHGDGGSGL